LNMGSSDQERPPSGRWVFEALVFGTMGLLLFCMMAGLDAGVYAAGFAGAVAALVLGRVSVRRQWVTAAEGITRVGTLWLWVIGFAALSLLNGKWEPAAFASVIGLTMTACYALGARSGR
jgi:hypothetical protein